MLAKEDYRKALTRENCMHGLMRGNWRSASYVLVACLFSTLPKVSHPKVLQFYSTVILGLINPTLSKMIG